MTAPGAPALRTLPRPPTHYFITTGSGQELEILQTQEGQDILPDGSAVTLTVKAGRINVFRRATEETLIREEGL